MRYYKNTLTGKGCSVSRPPDGDHYTEIALDEWRALTKKVQKDIQKKNAPVYDEYEASWDSAYTISDYDKVYWSHVTDEPGIGKLVTMFGGFFIRKFSTDLVDLTHGNTPAFIEILKKSGKLHPVDGVYIEPLDIYIMYDGIHRIMAWDSEDQDVRYYDRFPTANIEVTDNYLVHYREELELIELGELDSTTITEEQYKELLKLRNQWRNS